MKPIHYSIQVRGALIDLSTPQVMGILNCTPDSFYAGSRKQTEEEIAHRCKYVSPNGTPCRNMARPGSDFCGIHDAMENAEISSDSDSLI